MLINPPKPPTPKITAAILIVLAYITHKYCKLLQRKHKYISNSFLKYFSKYDENVNLLNVGLGAFGQQ